MGNYFHYGEGAFSASRSVVEEPRQEQYTMHTHSKAELYCFMGGSGVFHIEGTEYALEVGDVLIMAPGESHYIELDCSQPYDRCCVHFDPDLFQAMDPQNLLMKPFLERKPGTLNLYKGYEFKGGSRHYWDSMALQEGDRRLNALIGIMGLMNEIYSIYLSRDMEAHATGNTVEYRIIRYLNKNLSANISLDDICRKFFISKSQLCRLFKKATGTTIWQYITIKRLNLAQRMLREGEKPTKVCFDCGFNDYSAFYRAYLKQYGHGPNME